MSKAILLFVVTIMPVDVVRDAFVGVRIRKGSSFCFSQLLLGGPGGECQ